MTEEHKFYMKRCDAIQVYQRFLPEPHRTAICNILANGQATPYGDATTVKGSGYLVAIAANELREMFKPSPRTNGA